MINIPNIVDMINTIVNKTVNTFLGKFQELFSTKVLEIFDKVIVLPPELPIPPLPDPATPTTQDTVPVLSDEENTAISESGATPPKAVGAPVYWDDNGDLISDPNIVPRPAKPNPPVPTPPVTKPKTSGELNTKYPPETSTQVKPTLSGAYNSPSVYRASHGIKELIKESEHLMLTIYQDPDGVHADIGYGHVLGLWKDRASLPQTITVQQANAYFDQDIREAEADVKRLVRQKCTQGQFDSFLDLAYGAGGGWLAKSQTLATFNRGDICGTAKLYQDAATTGGGKPLKALKRRRMAIYNNYFINNWGVKCT